MQAADGGAAKAPDLTQFLRAAIFADIAAVQGAGCDAFKTCPTFVDQWVGMNDRRWDFPALTKWRVERQASPVADVRCFPTSHRSATGNGPVAARQGLAAKLAKADAHAVGTPSQTRLAQILLTAMLDPDGIVTPGQRPGATSVGHWMFDYQDL